MTYVIFKEKGEFYDERGERMIRNNDYEKIRKYIYRYGIEDIFKDEMYQWMELRFYKKNEYILRQGEPAHALHFFVEGKAKVFTTLSNGKSLLLCFYEGFRAVGDLELMNGEPAASNVQAIEDNWLIAIPFNVVREHLMNDTRFLNFMCSSLGEKLQRCSRNSAVNLLYPVENRLAGYILATAQPKQNQGKSIFFFNESLTETAELLGTSYRHLLRTLSSLCEKNIVMKRRASFEVINEGELKKLAADVYQ